MPCLPPNSVQTQLRYEVANGAADLSGVKVATFFASNTEISNACRIALEHLYRWYNASVETINETHIKNGELYNYDILVIPPGNLGEYTVKLNYDGLDAIRDFVRNGGSYVGISRGAHFACANVHWLQDRTYLLELFNGTGYGPIDGQLDQSMNVVDINTGCSEIDLSGMPSTLTMMQWEGIYFIPDDNPPMINVSYWTGSDRASQIAYQYGNGCVFLSGCHPELEEDSDRDGSDYFDHHEDPETDWPLMLQVSKWLVNASTWDNASITPPTPTTETTTTATSTSFSTTTETTTTATSTSFSTTTSDISTTSSVTSSSTTSPTTHITTTSTTPPPTSDLLFVAVGIGAVVVVVLIVAVSRKR